MVQETLEYVWIFHGEGAQFASGVFNSKREALQVIKLNNLKGILTKYPVGKLAYDFSVENGYFTPSKPHHFSPITKQKFSSPLFHIHIMEEE